MRGPALATLVVVEATDGYRVVCTLGELDPMLGNTPMFVVDRCEGQPLGQAEGRLRIVAPRDRRGARSVRQVERIRMVQLAD